jgi:FKBP-type peptidyl-prolyl cis-trans isomerase (trigger factor)
MKKETTKNTVDTYKFSVKQLENSEVEIKVETNWDYVSTFEDKALKTLGANVEIDGFRKGAVPDDILKKKIPDDLLLADMSETVISEIYPDIIKNAQVDAIGRPAVSITKIARGNNLEFTIKVATVPSIKLPDYKKLSSLIKLEESKEIKDEDVEKVVNDLRQMRAYGHVHGEGDTHSHTEELPGANDEFAKSFGAFQNMAEMRMKIKENLIKEADQNTRDKRRIGIMESIIKETDFPVPEVLLRSEMEKMYATIEADIAHSGGKMDEYLKHIKKTKEELLEDFKPESEKRARFQLVINAIAKDADISVSEEEVEAEAQKLMQMYPGADLSRSKAYADMVLTNEKVFSLLEGK